MKKEGYWPSFFLFPAFFFALLTSILASQFNYFLGITFLLALLFFKLPNGIKWTSISISVFLYSFIIILNFFFIDTAYTAEEFYYLGYFIIGFIVFSQLSIEQITHLYKLLVYLFLLLAVWALIQYYTGDYYIAPQVLRSNTIFTTPNTYAAAINLILFPLIADNLCKHNKKVLLAMAILFFTLLLTQSRGGIISFFIGFIMIWIYSLLTKKKLYWKKVLISLFAVTFVFFISHKIDWDHNSEQKKIDIIEATRFDQLIEHSNDRFILYDAAWKRIKEKPILGYGYNNFQFYWLKDQKLPFKDTDNGTNFVHNDYLQIWFETGLIGVLSFLLIVLLLYHTIFRYINNNNVLICSCIIGAMSAYFSHAMVDFVVSPCFLTLIFSGYLACANKVSSNQNFQKSFSIYTDLLMKNINVHFWQRFISFLAIILFSQSYIAEMSFNYAEKSMNKMEVEKAIPHYELARRFAPYNQYYYAQEGTYWRTIIPYVKDKDKEFSADRANDLFIKGANSNSYDVKNLLSRAVLNRDYAEILSNPADNLTIMNWFTHILTWQPKLIAAQYEYVNTLYKFGKVSEAKKMLNHYIKLQPNNVELLKLKNELSF